MPEYPLDKKSGLPLFGCTLMNKHQVSLPVQALLDTSQDISRVSYRIFSALGFETGALSSTDNREESLGRSCQGWILIDHARSDPKKLKANLAISLLPEAYDLVLGMDIMRTYFDLQIITSAERFIIDFH